MQIVSLSAYRNRELVAALEAAVVLAKEGTITGTVLVLKYGPHDHRVATCGDYRLHPEQALTATLTAERALSSGTSV
jgi:hypothetical protein